MMSIFHGYLVVVATFLLNMVALGTYYSAAEFLLPLESTFPTAGRGKIACLPSIYLSMALFASLPAGWIQDLLQRRDVRINSVFAVGGLCLGLGPLASSYGATLNAILTGAVITGCGIGLTGFIAAGICVQWFNVNRGTMLLLAMAGSGCGNFLYCNAMQCLTAYFDDRLHNNDEEGKTSCWRVAMRVAALVSMVIALLASTVMRLPHAGEVEEYEMSMGWCVQGRGDDNEDLLIGQKIDAITEGDEDDENEHDSEKNATDYFASTQGNDNITIKFNHGQGCEHEAPMCYGSIAQQLRRAPSAENSSICSSHLAIISNMRSVLTLNQSITMAAHHDDNSTISTRHSLQHDSLHFRRSSIIAEYEALSQLPINYRLSIVETRRCKVPEYSLDEIVKTRTTLCLLLWSFISSFAFTNFFVHLPAYAASVGLSPAAGSQALSLTGLFMLLGNVTLGGVTDWIGSIRTLQLTMTALVGCMLIWPHCTTSLSLNILAALYGYMSTTQSSVPLVILADAFGDIAPQTILTLVGLQNVCKFPGYFLGPMVVGHFYEMFGKTYDMAALLAAAFMFVGNVSLFVLPSAQHQIDTLIAQHKQQMY
jgi:MFS family permease